MGEQDTAFWVSSSESNTWTGSGVGRQNEDFALVDEEAQCAVLVDGATGLTKANIVPGESDATWFARTLSTCLAPLLADPKMSTIQALCNAGEATATSYSQFEGAAELARIDQPNGSVAVLRWQAGTVEVTLLGDCTAVVLKRNGSAVALHDDTLTMLDEQNYERMYQHAIRRGTTMAEARKALNPRFIENRLKMNQPDGYWAADISCAGMEHALSWHFDASEVAGLFACSDGYAAAVDMGVCADALELARRVAAGEGAVVGEQLRAAELEDAACWRVHRSKTSDDATYVMVRFEHKQL